MTPPLATDDATIAFMQSERPEKPPLLTRTTSLVPPPALVTDDEATIPVVGQPLTPPSHHIRKPSSSEVVQSFFVDNAVEDLLTSDVLFQEIHQLAEQQREFLVTTRRDLHKIPELMYNEKQTSAYVQKALKDLGIAFTTGWGVNIHQGRIPGEGGFGIVADIGTKKEPCVILRADMDALPIFELTEGIDEYKSTHPGVMHACGHDSHTAMLLGAARILKGMERSIKGTIRLVFQPAEEGGAGAKRMVEEGLLKLEPKARHAFALHVNPKVPSGIVASRPGNVKAASERFEVHINGVGGHAAFPQYAKDPILAMCAIVNNLQSLVNKNKNTQETGLCTVTKFEAGQSYNVIAASGVIRGTIRAYSTETLLVLKDKVEETIVNTAKENGCTTSITYGTDFYPALWNDKELYEFFSRDIAAMVSTNGEVLELPASMGAEDFAFIAEKLPSSYFMIGSGSGTNPPTDYGLHDPRFALDESILTQGAELHVNLALRALQMLGQVATE